jgi:hypothetical protein
MAILLPSYSGAAQRLRAYCHFLNKTQIADVYSILFEGPGKTSELAMVAIEHPAAVGLLSYFPSRIAVILASY